MENNYSHMDAAAHPQKVPESFFRSLQPPFRKDKEEIWAELEARLSDTPAHPVFRIAINRSLAAAAALVILLTGVLLVMRFYTRTVECLPGQHLSYEFPDGSTILMNAGSELSYQPLWWNFQRTVGFEGEGLFEVEKGRPFEVVSRIGRTIVLGTRFNVYSRDNGYKVTCLTGSVRVVSFTGNEKVLSPLTEAAINPAGEIKFTTKDNGDKTISWTNNMFYFTAIPLQEVLQEIGRQFGTEIRLRSGKDFTYSGYFSKDKSLEEVLEIVCKPFGLNFARSSENAYEIFQE